LDFAPYGRRRAAYIVPSGKAEAFARFQRRYFGFMFVAVIGGAFAFGPLIMTTVIAPLWLAGYLGKIWHFTRRLDIATEIPMVSREAALERTAHAMGSRTIVIVACIATLLASLGTWILARGERSIALGALTGYFALVGVLYWCRWWQFRSRAPAT